MENIQQAEQLDFSKVWLMFQETDRKINELKHIVETKINEHKSIIDSCINDIEKIKKDIKNNINNNNYKDSDSSFFYINSDYNKKYSFTTEKGMLVDFLADNELFNLLPEIGIDILTTTRRVKSHNKNKPFEFDIIAENGKDVVIVEVKTTLSVDDVKDFLKDLANIRDLLPKYKDKNIFGAVGYITEEGASTVFAQKKGLYVIRATGDSSSIINAEDFKPKCW